MQVIVLFVAIAAIMDVVAVGICSLIERWSEWASLLVFLGLFVGNFIVAWNLAVYLTEKYLVTANQMKANDEHKNWVNSLFIPVRR